MQGKDELLQHAVQIQKDMEKEDEIRTTRINSLIQQLDDDYNRDIRPSFSPLSESQEIKDLKINEGIGTLRRSTFIANEKLAATHIKDLTSLRSLSVFKHFLIFAMFRTPLTTSALGTAEVTYFILLE